MAALQLTHEDLECKLKNIHGKIYSETYAIDKIVTGALNIEGKGKNADKILDAIVDAFCLLDICYDKLQVTPYWLNSFSSYVYSAFITANYGLRLLEDLSSQKNFESAKSIIPLEPVDFTKNFPLPREEMLTSAVKFLKRTDQPVIVNLTNYFNWMRDQALSQLPVFEAKNPNQIPNLKVIIDNDFEISGFSKPMAAIKKASNGNGWDDIGGYTEVVEYFKDLELLMDNHDRIVNAKLLKPTEVVPKAILMIGPPGTGKSTMAKIFCHQIDIPYFYISASDIGDAYQNSAKNQLQAKFNDAADPIKNGAYRYSIMFLDEMDAYLMKKGTDSRDDNKAVSVFCENVKGLQDVNGVIVLGATNHPELLEPAVYDRFRSNFLYVPAPDLETSISISNVHLKGRENSLSEKDLRYILVKSGYYSNDGKNDSDWTGRRIAGLIENTYRRFAIDWVKGSSSSAPGIEDYLRQLPRS
jgi:SpoVK/Ycf46/Vps4 family AAA+-type ATPase